MRLVLMLLVIMSNAWAQTLCTSERCVQRESVSTARTFVAERQQVVKLQTATTNLENGTSWSVTHLKPLKTKLLSQT